MAARRLEPVPIRPYPATTGLQATYAGMVALLETARGQLDAREYDELVQLLIHRIAAESARLGRGRLRAVA